MFAGRLKELRREKNITQVQLAETLGVSKGTVAMWETGQRQPKFETLNTLSAIFDKRIDYIMGYSNDSSSVKLIEEEIDRLGIWQIKDDLYKMAMLYLRLDEFGKHTVESVINAEIARCKTCNLLLPEDNFMLSLEIRNNRK